MPLLSVITAAQAHRAPLLRDTAESLAAQELPDGWGVEWLLQEDGAAPALADLAAGYPFARYQANGEQLGVAITRNYALARAEGGLVQVLDSDDVLLPGALATMIEIMDTHPDVHWATAQADDLRDGVRIPFPLGIPAGRIPVGAFTAFLVEHGALPVIPGSLVARTGTVRALGGWVGLPCGEDTALLVALSEISDGYVTSEVTWLLRRHPGNMSATARSPEETALLAGIVHQRAEAIRSVGLRLAP